jgi:hypothetical protein
MSCAKAAASGSLKRIATRAYVSRMALASLSRPAALEMVNPVTVNRGKTLFLLGPFLALKMAENPGNQEYNGISH